MYDLILQIIDDTYIIDTGLSLEDCIRMVEYLYATVETEIEDILTCEAPV